MAASVTCPVTDAPPAPSRHAADAVRPAPAISVIVPRCNRAELLPVALDAILSQSLQPAEIIVVDDAPPTAPSPACAWPNADAVALRRGTWLEARSFAAAPPASDPACAASAPAGRSSMRRSWSACCSSSPSSPRPWSRSAAS